jgi:hypothetical protein
MSRNDFDYTRGNWKSWVLTWAFLSKSLKAIEIYYPYELTIKGNGFYLFEWKPELKDV